MNIKRICKDIYIGLGLSGTLGVASEHFYSQVKGGDNPELLLTVAILAMGIFAIHQITHEMGHAKNMAAWKVNAIIATASLVYSSAVLTSAVALGALSGFGLGISIVLAGSLIVGYAGLSLKQYLKNPHEVTGSSFDGWNFFYGPLPRRRLPFQIPPVNPNIQMLNFDLIGLLGEFEGSDHIVDWDMVMTTPTVQQDALLAMFLRLFPVFRNYNWTLILPPGTTFADQTREKVLELWQLYFDKEVDVINEIGLSKIL